MGLPPPRLPEITSREPLALGSVCAWGGLLLLIICGSGCRALRGKGPVTPTVVQGRQFATQGRLAVERGDWGRAESMYSRAVENNPTDSPARMQYAESLWHRGASQAALAQLEEARKNDPADPTISVRAGEMYLATGEVEKALAAANDALHSDSRLGTAWILRGQVYEMRGDVRLALADYQRGASYSEGTEAALLHIAEAYRKLNQPDRALATLQSMTELYPSGEEPAQVLYLKGIALAALRRDGDAATTFRVAAERGSPRPELWCQLAQAELRLGNANSARGAIEKALALDPTHPLGLELQGQLQMARASDGRKIR